MRRDFTYVDDVTEALVRLIDHVPQGNPQWSGAAPDPGSSAAPWRIYNIGNNKPEELTRVVAISRAGIGTQGRKAVAAVAARRRPGDLCRHRCAPTIAAPTHLHRDLAIAGIHRGAHVLVEKPIASSVEEGRAIIAAAVTPASR